MESIDSGTLPELLESIEDKVIVQISSGLDHFLFLTSTGEIYSMGSGMRGQLGITKDVEESRKPLLVDTLQGQKITSISCGRSSSGAITDKREVRKFRGKF